LETDVDVARYWPDDTPVGRHLSVFRRHFPATTTLTILLEGEPGSMKTPEAMRVMAGLQRAMAADPGVGRTSSVADIIRRTHEIFAPEEASGGLPDDPALVAQLFFLADSPAFERFVDRGYSRSVVLGFLEREDSGLTRRVLGRLHVWLERHPPETIQVSLAGGTGPTLLAINEHTVKGKALNIATVLAAIFVIAGILLDSALGGAYVVAPLATVVAVNLGLFAWLGVAFDIAGASVAAMGVGIGADYAIYFLYRLREEFGRSGSVEAAVREAIDTTGRAVLFVALAIGAGFAVYLAADYVPLRVCGFFVPLTMLVSSLTSLTLLPALALWLRPRFLFARRPKRRPAAVRAGAEQGRL
ncbi:MAG: MMPL family transporter, partial [Candidatus Binatia bacterium]